MSTRAVLAALCIVLAGCGPRLTGCEQRGESLDLKFSSLVSLRVLRMKPDGATLIGDVKGGYSIAQIKELRIDSRRELSVAPNVGATIVFGVLTEECAQKVRKAAEPWGKLKEGEPKAVANPAA